MKNKIYDILKEHMYSLSSCDYCQYSDISMKRIPCNKCDGWDKFKLQKGHEADLKVLTRKILRVIKDGKQN